MEAITREQLEDYLQTCLNGLGYNEKLALLQVLSVASGHLMPKSTSYYEILALDQLSVAATTALGRCAKNLVSKTNEASLSNFTKTSESTRMFGPRTGLGLCAESQTTGT